MQHLDSHPTQPFDWKKDAMKSLGTLKLEPLDAQAHPKHPSETDLLEPFAEAQSGAHCWLLERHRLFLFPKEVLQYKEFICQLTEFY